MSMVGWLLAIGTVWGITNVLLKRGALIAEKAKRTTDNKEISMMGSFLGEWNRLLHMWQYLLPFLLNLSMSVLFVIKLGDSPIMLAVPVTNATTFAVTAIAGAALGEIMRRRETLVGVALIVAGVTLCTLPPIRVFS